MTTRRLSAAALVAAVLGLAASAGRAQDSKDKAPDVKELLKDYKPVEESFQTADGVKLRGVFYDAINPNGGAQRARVVLMLHGYKQNPDEAVWDDTAKLLATKGYHSFRFDFRGHGKSKDIIAREFWDARMPWAAMNNRGYIKGADKAATKVTIDVKEFAPKYYPMLANDIEAARIHLDKKNDAGQLNSSSIYVLAADDMVGAALLFAAAEWKRERKRPNFDLISPFLTPGRELFGNTEPAGPDIRGAIWLGPTFLPGSGVAADDIKKWVMSPYALDLRMETQMLFLYGKKDTRAMAATNTLYDNVLKILDPSDPKTKGKTVASESGKKLPNPDQSFKRAIDKTDLRGAKLLGNNLGTEAYIEGFISKVEEERKNRERTPTRGWDKPPYIDVIAFGVGR